jgi:signal transduction histidine kinase
VGRLTKARLGAVTIAVVGIVATVIAARAASMSAEDTAQLVALGAGVAAGGTLLAVVSLRLLRGRTIVGQVVAVMSTTLATVALGAWAGANAMFISQHDLHVLVVVLCAAATVGLATNVVLGARVGAAATSLVEGARRIGDGHAPIFDREIEHVTHTAELARELELTAQRLADARQRERALEASRRELIAWVSHDLRTPLAGIRAMAEALEDGVVEGDEAHRYYRLLRDEAEHVAHLVDDLFELSRTQTGVLDLELQRISLDDLLSDAVAGITPVARAKGVRLERRVTSPPPECAGSPPELLRALRNLLENAVRHTPSDGAVVVEAAVDGRDAVLCITDDGGGIAGDDLPRVFEAGFRGDPSRSERQGAGLGLAIAKGIVEAHHGQIAVANENGGARFTIRIPLDADAS